MTVVNVGNGNPTGQTDYIFGTYVHIPPTFGSHICGVLFHWYFVAMTWCVIWASLSITHRPELNNLCQKQHNGDHHSQWLKSKFQINQVFIMSSLCTFTKNWDILTTLKHCTNFNPNVTYQSNEIAIKCENIFAANCRKNSGKFFGDVKLFFLHSFL